MAIQETEKSKKQIEGTTKMLKQNPMDNKLIQSGMHKSGPIAEQMKQEHKQEIKKEEPAKPEEPKKQEKPEMQEKKAEKKEEKKKQEKLKKDYALVNGNDLHMSPKVAKNVCDMIQGINLDNATKRVEEVIAFKRAVKMNSREVGHRHGQGMMAGRYPINAAEEFLRLLKQLRANAIYHELELEKCVIFCKADKASQPYKRGGARFKRTHVMLKLVKSKKIAPEAKKK